MSQWGGKPALNEKADKKKSSCTNHVALAVTKEKSENIAPGGQNEAHKNMQRD